MDLSKLNTNQKIVGGAGILAIIALFLPWYGFSAFGISASENAFGSGFWAWCGTLLVIAAAVIVVLKIADLKAGNLAAEQLALLLAALGLLFIVIRLLTENDLLKFGIWVALIAAVGVAYGTFAAMKDAGMAMPNADSFKSS